MRVALVGVQLIHPRAGSGKLVVSLLSLGLWLSGPSICTRVEIEEMPGRSRSSSRSNTGVFGEFFLRYLSRVLRVPLMFK